jgi:hypothetical protein
MNGNYKRYKEISNEWQNIIMPIYWTSTCAGLYSENLSMLYKRINSNALKDYKFMLDDMASTFHFLVYGTKISPDNGYKFPKWHFYTFEEIPGVRKPPSYIQVGSRMIFWCNEESDFGAFPQNVVLNAIAYACIRNVSENNAETVKIIQVYHTFSRKICSLSLANWSLEEQAQYINFIRKAKKSVFDGYEL